MAFTWRKIPDKYVRPMPLWRRKKAIPRGERFPKNMIALCRCGSKMPIRRGERFPTNMIGRCRAVVRCRREGEYKLKKNPKSAVGNFKLIFRISWILDLPAELGEIPRRESPGTNVIGLCRAVVRCRRE